MFKKFTIFIITFFFLHVFCFSEEIILGGNYGWKNIITNNTSIIEKPGISVITLSDFDYDLSPETEVLMHFDMHADNASKVCSVSNKNNISISGFEKKMGSGSAVFYGDENYITILPSRYSAFSAGSGRLNDFSIEFWLNPSTLAEGANIIQWAGAKKETGKIIYQNILCTISNRSIEWDFSNIFISASEKTSSFKLRSSRSLIPKRWHHHMVRYNSSTGLLEYLIDGVPEDIIHTSSTGKEKGELFYPLPGEAKPARFIVGRGYTGYLDELRITSSFAEPQLDKYSKNCGTAKSQILDLEYYGSRFYYLEASVEKNFNTEIYFYYRISNNYFDPYSEKLPWKQIKNGEMLPPQANGKYLQIMVELYPDGTGENTPVLSEIIIHYEINLPPLPPSYISAKAGDNKVKLSWKAVTDPDIAGYKIYYGDKPGIYFGNDSFSGASPINVGNKLNFTLEGLENGKLYYFTITSYDNVAESHESVFSREVSARPSVLFNEIKE